MEELNSNNTTEVVENVPSAPPAKVEKISLAELRKEMEIINQEDHKTEYQYSKPEKKAKEITTEEEYKPTEEDLKNVEEFFDLLKNASPEVLEEFTRQVKNGALKN